MENTTHIFEKTHEEGVNLLGNKWLTANEKAVHIASMLEVNYRDKNIRMMISKIILETAKICKNKS